MIKDQEYLKSKALYCLDLAKKLGATDASVTIGNSISETVNFRNKVLDESNRSDSLAMGIEIYIGKKKSSITSSNLLDGNLKVLIEKCFQTTKITPEDEFNSLPDKELLAKNIKDLNLFDQSHIENDKKIDYLKELEEVASVDKKIINTESSFTEDKSNFILANSDGFCNGYKTSSFTASCVTVAKNENSMERDYEFTSKCHLNDISSPFNLGKNAAEQTIKKLSPKKISSDKLSIIFDKRISKGFLSSFAGAISASAIARGTSFLKDKLNQQIFSNPINVIDKPDLVKGMGSKCFDSEGVKADTLELVTNGDKLTSKDFKNLFSIGINHFVVSLYDGEHQLKKFNTLFAKAGLSEEHYSLRDRWHDSDKNFGLKLTNRGGTIKIGEQPEVVLKKPCYYPSYSMTIDWNGDVLVCMQDWNKKVKFGNARSQSLFEIWQNKAFSKYRMSLLSGTRKFSPCNKCNAEGTMHGFNHADAWTYRQKHVTSSVLKINKKLTK